MKLRMNNCDEVNHGGVRYPVSNSGRHLGVGEIEVPDHVGHVLLRTGAGAVRIDDDSEPEDFVAMKHPGNPHTSLTARGFTYHPENGVVHVNAAAVADAIRRGFVLVEE